MAPDEVLVACTPGAVDSARIAFADTYPLRFVHRVEQALELIVSQRFRLVIGTLQFDDSRLFDLLPAAKASATPAIIAKLTYSHLPRDVITNSFKAALLSGFDACIDLESLEQTLGPEQAIAEARKTVMRYARRD